MKETVEDSSSLQSSSNCEADSDVSMSIEERARTLYRGEALAPMVRASTTPLRTLALKYGADFVYTEELVDRSLSNTHRVINERLGTIDYLKDTAGMSKKQKKKVEVAGGPPVLLRIDPAIEKGRLVCQLGTGEANLALKAALHVHRDVDSIDVNMGCPKKFSVSGGMGSALLNDPERASLIIRNLRNNLKVPVSAKIRLLRDTASTLDFCQSLINARVNAIAIHARRVGDESMTPADWETLQEVVQLLKSKEPSLPILVNGDFYTRDEWTTFQSKSGADGVLLARPALYNTSIFVKPSVAASPLSSTTTFGYDSPLLLSKTAVVKDYLRQAIRYDNNYKNVKYVVCEMMNNRRAPTPRVFYMKQVFEGGQNIGSVCNCHSLKDMCKLWDVTCDVQRDEMNRTQQPAGEHVYKDSYFLGQGKNGGKSEVGVEAPSKRARIEETKDSDRSKI